MANLGQVCDVQFQTNDQGNLIPDPHKLFYPVIIEEVEYFGIFAFYFGQLLFRYFGYGCLEQESFDGFSQNFKNRRC